MPREVFEYLYPANHKQLAILNKCQRSQWMENLRHLLYGAPYTQNAIYDLHLQLEAQIHRGLLWKNKNIQNYLLGKQYRPPCISEILLNVPAATTLSSR